MKNLKVGVLGDGGWGTTLAILLHKNGFRTCLWGAFSNYVATLRDKRVNSRFLPKIKIPAAIEITDNLSDAIFNKDIIVIAVPSQYLRQVLKKAKQLDYPRQGIWLSVVKGIEVGSLKRMSEVIKEELGNIEVAVLSGPTIAHEVALGIPTTAVAASRSLEIRRKLQDIFTTDNFRVYTNDDICGVELGGSLKNVIAIACGISDGLGFGTNAKAALLARGLAEISRLGKVMGAKPATFNGISGLGDLVTTCISSYSRNRFVGEQIGKGKSLKQVVGQMQMVAEGVATAKSAYQLSRRFKVNMPIVKEVYNILYKNKSSRKAVKDLMTRQKKEE